MASEEAKEKLVYLDLDESTYKANSKFELVAIASCAISILELDPTSTFFGLSFRNVNEPLLEIVFLLGALGLFYNFHLRLKDEGKVVARLSQQSAELREVASSVVADVKASLTIVKNAINFDDIHNDLKRAFAMLDAMEAVDTSKLQSEMTAALRNASKRKKTAVMLRNLSADEDPYGLATVDASDEEMFANEHINEATNSLSKINDYANRILSYDTELHNWFIRARASLEATSKLDKQFLRISSRLESISQKVESVSVSILEDDVKPDNAARRISYFIVVWPRLLAVAVILSFTYANVTRFELFAYLAGFL